MECINIVFPIILYILAAVLLVVLIILALKSIKTLKKVDEVIDDVNQKSAKLNGVFNIIDNTTDAIATVSDKAVDLILTGVQNLFRGKKKKKDEGEENE